MPRSTLCVNLCHRMKAKTKAATAAQAASRPSGAILAAGLVPEAPPVIDDKPLADVIRICTGAQEQPAEDAGVDARFLEGASDARLKEAGALVKEGLAGFRKATDGKSEKGEARDALLNGAREKFEKALALLVWATAGKPDAQTERLMGGVNLLIYGCLKHQGA